MLLLIAAAALAVVPSPTPSPSPTPVPEIAHVVTSDRNDESLTRATRVTFVVTKDQIARNGYRTIGDTLSSIPGVELEQRGAIGSTPSYGIRGSSSAQVLVLVNGLPAPGSLANSVDLGTFSTAGVRRVEVVEGGGSTLYGTGAIGGVINIITDSNSTAPGAVLRYGSFADRELDVNALGFSLERIVANNNYSLPAYTSFGTPVATTRANSQYQATTARYGWQHRLGAVDFSATLGILDSQGGEPGYYPYNSTTATQSELSKDAGLSFRLSRKQSTTTLQLGATVQQIAYDCNETQDPYGCFQPSASLSDESRLAMSLRNAVDAGAHQIVYGVDLSRGTVMTNTGGGFIPTQPSQTPPPDVTSNAFAQTAAYIEDAFDVRPGLRAYAGMRGERDGSLGGEYSPSLGIEARIAGPFTLKLNYADAFRAPNASEVFYPGYGNPNLQAERAKVGDATLSDASLLGGVSVGWFANHTNDLIVPVLIYANAKTYTYIYQPQNIDHAVMQGLTLQAKTLPYHSLRATFNVTDLYTAKDLDSGARLPNDPVFNVNVGLEWLAATRGSFAGAGLSFQAVGARGPVDYTQPLFFQPAAYADVNAFVAFHVMPRADVFLRGYNLGNERYAEIGGYPMPGRSFAVELRSR